MFSKSTKGTTKPPELEMTPMIDIVFQLLVFFVMTFRITALEGDFQIQMPIQSNQPAALDENLDQPIVVTLKSGDNRNLASIQIDDQAPFTEDDKLERLAAYVAQRAQQEDPAADTKIIVEFVIDYDLRYSATVSAVTAVTGRKKAGGVLEQFVDTIKFRDQGARGD